MTKFGEVMQNPKKVKDVISARLRPEYFDAEDFSAEKKAKEIVEIMLCPGDFGLEDFSTTGRFCAHGQDEEVCRECWEADADDEA